MIDYYSRYSAEYVSTLRGKIHDGCSSSVVAPRVDSARSSWEELFVCLQRSAFRKMSHDRAYLFVNPHVRSENGKRSDGLEGFARTFLGLSFYFAGGPSRDVPDATLWLDAYVEGLCHGSDPGHPGFWGAIRSPQLLVECASVAVGLMISGSTFWGCLSPQNRNNLLALFRANSQRQFHENNWLWFRLLQNLALEKLGGEDHRVAILADMDHLGRMYRGDGWYHDGLPRDGYRNLDYYNAYAMHFYGLLFSRIQDGRYEAISGVLRDRARVFFEEYRHLFPVGGHPPLFGRSMIYRFATIAPWGVGVLTDSCSVPFSEVKHLCIDTVNAYLDRGSVQPSGRLGFGVYGEQPFVREGYSGGGSPYWAFKAFSLLLLPESHEFWRDSSVVNGSEPNGVYSLAGGDLYSVKQNSLVTLINPGLSHKWYDFKYNRFAYSNRYPATLDGAYPVDNMLLIRRPGARHWSHRSHVIEQASITKEKSCLWRASYDDGIDIRTTLLPLPWGYIAHHSFLGEGEVEFATGGFPSAVRDGVMLLPPNRSDLLGFTGPDGWSALLRLSGPADKGSYYRSSRGISPSGVTIPLYSGKLGAPLSRELAVAILVGDDFAGMETVILEVRSIWDEYSGHVKPPAPAFSLLMANYNNAQFMHEAILSVIDQSFLDWELIVVDDGSTDDSVKVVSDFVRRDSRIRLVVNVSNRGCGYTKRKCAAEASGEILAYLDPDDALTPDALEKLHLLHKIHPECSIIYSTHFICHENLDPVEIAAYVGQIPLGKSHATTPWTGPVISHFATFKKRHYDKTDGINPCLKRAVDQDLYNKLEEVGSCLYIDEPLYYYRHNRNSISVGDNNIKAIYWNYLVFSDTFRRRRKSEQKFAPRLTRVALGRKRLGYFIAKAYQKAERREWRKMYYCLARAMPAVYLDRRLMIARIALTPFKNMFRKVSAEGVKH